jgi:hypothetical protein
MHRACILSHAQGHETALRPRASGAEVQTPSELYSSVHKTQFRSCIDGCPRLLHRSSADADPLRPRQFFDPHVAETMRPAMAAGPTPSL